MTSDDATCLKYTIVSPSDPRIEKLKYAAGTKFLLTNPDSIECADKTLLSKKIILEIISYALTAEGEIAYDLTMVEPEDSEHYWHWLMNDQDLEDSFLFIGDDIRFVLDND